MQNHKNENEKRRRLEHLAWLLDSSIPIPGTRYSIGLEALIGLVPFLGDLVGVILSATILAEAARLGVGKSVLARMAFNVALEGLVGLIPLAGDVFDAAWKANQRNVRLLGDWLERPARAERASKLFLFMIILGLAAFAAVTLSLTYLLLRWLVA
ncbi:MAG TPA: DUF4112 domain-containing protein [Burkholderiales bacterium]|nr:DUF4112 domain-containing protein [Burkholderiales bacterium]